MWVHFLGVRGSTPATAPNCARYGGNTSCVAISFGDSVRPTLVLDAGTGLSALSEAWEGTPFQGSILLSHLHWDHVMGLPFFRAGDRVGSRVDVHLPAQNGMTGQELMTRVMSPPSFPIGPDGLNGDWTFVADEPGAIEVSGFDVTAFEVAHKGGRTYGFVVAADGARLAYLPDHAPALGLDEAVVELLRGVDLIIHDAQMIESERYFADEYGHATIDDAIDMATRVDARATVLFHHSPTRTDDELDALAARIGPTMIFARQGMVLELTGAQRRVSDPGTTQREAAT